MKRLLTILLIFLPAVVPAHAATRTWTGSTSGNWSIAANWDGTVPVSGDDLVFPSETHNEGVMNNDLPLTNVYQSMTFDRGTYTLHGNALRLGAGGITQTNGAMADLIVPIALTASQTWMSDGNWQAGLIATAGSDSILDLGTNNLTILGDGFVWFRGSPIVGTGTLTLDDTVTARFLAGGGSSATVPIILKAGATITGEGATFAGPVLFNDQSVLFMQSNGTATFSNVTFSAGSTYEANLADPSSSSVINAGGTTILSGNLVVRKNQTVPAAAVFTIVHQEGAGTISGTFNGLPEGATIHNGNQDFVISYVGGSGHDVTLTAQPGAGSTSNTLTLHQDSPTSIPDESVTFSATIVPNTASGVVDFMDGTNVIGSASLSSGRADFTTTTLPIGSHSVVAVYEGTSTYTQTQSTALTHLVQQATSLTLTASPNPSAVGQNVTLTATLGTIHAIGTIIFLDGFTPISPPIIISDGVATFTTSSLSAGSHDLRASYSGISDYYTSLTPPAVQIVSSSLTATTTTLTNTPSGTLPGQPVTLKATVSPLGATGSVTFYDGTVNLGTVSLNAQGTATLVVSNLASGAHTLTAAYGGDSSYIASTSAPVTQNVAAGLPGDPTPMNVPTLDARALLAMAALLAIVGAMAMRR